MGKIDVLIGVSLCEVMWCLKWSMKKTQMQTQLDSRKKNSRKEAVLIPHPCLWYSHIYLHLLYLINAYKWPTLTEDKHKYILGFSENSPTSTTLLCNPMTKNTISFLTIPWWDREGHPDKNRSTSRVLNTTTRWWLSATLCWRIVVKLDHHLLVGGFNPFEK